MRIANLVFALAFALAVAVQYNDPDPLPWMAMYASGLVVCVLWEIVRLRRIAPVLVGSAALVWGVWVALAMELTAPVGEALTDWQMHAGGSEELRESLGLFLVAGWMAALAARPVRKPR